MTVEFKLVLCHMDHWVGFSPGSELLFYKNHGKHGSNTFPFTAVETHRGSFQGFSYDNLPGLEVIYIR